MDLHSEQEKIHSVIGGFLRTDRSDDALWVSDYPRRNADTEEMLEKLKKRGVCCMLDEKTRLWHLDWTEDKWDALIAALPHTCPAIPKDEQLHAAYAFCRFALAHPAPRTEKSMRMLRAVLKGAKTMRQLYEEAAQALREEGPIAYDAGRLLAFRLMKGEMER